MSRSVNIPFLINQQNSLTKDTVTKDLLILEIKQLLMRLRHIPCLNQFLLRHQFQSFLTYKTDRVHSASRLLHTSDRVGFQFEKMESTALDKRVLVWLKTKGSSDFRKAHFTECIVDYVDEKSENGVCCADVELKDNNLFISPASDGQNKVKMKHPSFCPIHHLTEAERASLPEDIFSRGIDCGAAVILESGDGQVFLTRRADNLRTFPGIWVPPGGHIEQNETLFEAGLRELREETGLEITKEMCQEDTVHILAVWESVFPPKLSLGQPKRHHAVVYLHAKLKPHTSAQSLMSKVRIDPAEVGGCAWFDRPKVEAIVAAREENLSSLGVETNLDTFSAIVLKDNKQVETQLPFSDLLKTAGVDKDQRGRVSTGTKFALEEWLAGL